MSELDPKMVGEIRRTWALAAENGTAVAELFYARLFDMDPELAPLFAGTDMAAQHDKLLQALGSVVAAADDLGAAVPSLRDLGARHVRYGAQPAHYETVGAALLWTLERGLGDAFRPETKAAWSVAYALLAGAMVEGARRQAA